MNDTNDDIIKKDNGVIQEDQNNNQDNVKSLDLSDFKKGKKILAVFLQAIS